MIIPYNNGRHNIVDNITVPRGYPSFHRIINYLLGKFTYNKPLSVCVLPINIYLEAIYQHVNNLCDVTSGQVTRYCIGNYTLVQN